MKLSVNITKKEIYGIAVILIVIGQILTIGLSLYTLAAFGDVQNKYEEQNQRYLDTLATLRTYDIRVKYDIEDLNGTEYSLEMSTLVEPYAEYNQDGTLNKWTYKIGCTTNNLEADFRTIFLAVMVPIEAYNRFATITAKWQIETKIDYLYKADLTQSSPNGFYKIASKEVTSWLWKENVPDALTVEITLTIK